MSTTLSNAVTRLMLPLVWGRRPDHAARALRRFARTEADSGWQYLRAIEHAQDPGLRRMLFHQVLEEYRHADHFHGVAGRLAVRRDEGGQGARRPLVRSAADLAGFLACAHVCEGRIHSQFRAFAQACRIPEVSEVFLRVRADEQGHEASALSQLRHLLDGHAGRVRTKVLAARASCLHDTWMRGARRIGDAVFGLLLTALFLGFGALTAWPGAAARREAAERPGAGEPPPAHDPHGPSRAAAIAAAITRRPDIG